MKKIFPFLLLTLVFLNLKLYAISIENSQNVPIKQLDIYENKGQIIDENGNQRNDILYITNYQGIKIAFTKNGLTFNFSKLEVSPENAIKKSKIHKLLRTNDRRFTLSQTKLSFVSSNPDVEIIAENPSDDYSNYYYPHCPDGILGVHSYKKITYKNLYKDIDLVLASSDNSGQFQYHFVIRAGGNVNDIKMKADNAEGFEIIDKNSIKIKNTMGEINLAAPKLILIDKSSKVASMIPNFNLSSNIFELKENTMSDYILGNTTIEWTAYYGGSNEDQVWNMKRDNNNNPYCIGRTESMDDFFPQRTTGDAIKGGQDVFIIKLNPAGNKSWVTFYGGTNEDEAWNIAVNNINELVVVGRTNSEDFPTTSGVFQKTIGSPNVYDAFIIKLDNSGTVLWSTFFGGAKEEAALAVSFAKDNYINFGGYTQSRTDEGFAVSAGAFQNQFTGGTDIEGQSDFPNSDGYIAVLTPDGKNLYFSSYIGGGRNDVVWDMATAPNLDVVAVGLTFSNNFLTKALPSAGNPWQQNYAGNGDGFIVRFTANNKLQWGTFFGGTGYDEAGTVAFDVSGNIIVAGLTTTDNSSAVDFSIASSGSNYPKYIGGSSDGYIAKFKESGSERVWGTYIGTPAADVIMDIDIASNGIIGVIGYTDIDGVNGIDCLFGCVTSSGTYPGFLNINYFGGSSNDYGNAIVFTENPNIMYIAGKTFSDDLPNVTSGYNYKGNGDGFLIRTAIPPTSIEEKPDYNNIISVFPNPSENGIFRVMMNSENTDECQIKVTNIIGLEILNFTHNLNAENIDKIIDLSSQPAGIYFLNVQIGNNKSSIKLIKD